MFNELQKQQDILEELQLLLRLQEEEQNLAELLASLQHDSTPAPPAAHPLSCYLACRAPNVIILLEPNHARIDPNPKNNSRGSDHQGTLTFDLGESVAIEKSMIQARGHKLYLPGLV